MIDTTERILAIEKIPSQKSIAENIKKSEELSI
jgi:hypothetical protein